MKQNNFRPWLIVIFVSAAILVWEVIDPSGRLSETLRSYSNPLVSLLQKYWLIGLVLIGLITVGVSILINQIGKIRSGESKARKMHPSFFEEMQAMLRSTLLPFGFEEQEGKGYSNRTRYSKYTRGELSISLWLDVVDAIYHLDASSATKVGDDQEEPVKDFALEGYIVTADTFKNDSITKLDEWLVEHRVK